jgi:hypothetical protein
MEIVRHLYVTFTVDRAVRTQTPLATADGYAVAPDSAVTTQVVQLSIAVPARAVQ